MADDLGRAAEADGLSSDDRAPAGLTGSAASIPDADPIILVSASDAEQKPLLYACGKCGSVHSPAIYLAREEIKHATALEAARDCYNCKTHNTCSYCDAECPKGWTACDACRYQRKLGAAVEVPDGGGPYCAFDGDTYFTEMEEAVDAGLEWVSPCHVTYPKLDADSVLENLLDDMHEDASIDDMDGVNEFYAAVEAFNKAQRTQSWFGDVKRKIRVPAQTIEARRAETHSGSVHESVVAESDAPTPSHATVQAGKPGNSATVAVPQENHHADQ